MKQGDIGLKLLSQNLAKVFYEPHPVTRGDLTTLKYHPVPAHDRGAESISMPASYKDLLSAITNDRAEILQASNVEKR